MQTISQAVETDGSPAHCIIYKCRLLHVSITFHFVCLCVYFPHMPLSYCVLVSDADFSELDFTWRLFSVRTRAADHVSVTEWVEYPYRHCLFSRWNSDTTTQWGWTCHSLLMLLFFRSPPTVSKPVLLTFLDYFTDKSLHSSLHFFMNHMFVIILQNPFQDNKYRKGISGRLLVSLQICFFVIIKIFSSTITTWLHFKLENKVKYILNVLLLLCKIFLQINPVFTCLSSRCTFYFCLKLLWPFLSPIMYRWAEAECPGL